MIQSDININGNFSSRNGYILVSGGTSQIQGCLKVENTSVVIDLEKNEPGPLMKYGCKKGEPDISFINEDESGCTTDKAETTESNLVLLIDIDPGCYGHSESDTLFMIIGTGVAIVIIIAIVLLILFVFNTKY